MTAYGMSHVKSDIARKLRARNVQSSIVQESLGVSYRTLHRWTHDTCTPLQPRGRPVALSSEHRLFIKQAVIKKPTITQVEIRHALMTEHGISVSQQTIHRTLQNMNITYKVLTKIPVKGDTELQHKFVKDILKNDVEYTAFDEAAVVTPCSPRYGYAERGHRAEIKTDSLPRKRVSLLVAISSRHSRPIFWLSQHNVNTAAVHKFLSRLPWSNSTLILDNASYHRQVRHHWTGNVLYLPPYSPQLNPVELFFQTFKAKLRRSFACDSVSIKRILHQTIRSCHGPNLFEHC